MDNNRINRDMDITRDELSQIFTDLQTLVGAYGDLSIAPLPLSEKALTYLNGDITHMKNRTEKDGVTAAAPQFSSLEALRAHIGECTRCGLHRNRNKMVFGEGDAGARLIFIGEGPGADEDRAGRPFVGRAGELLTKIITDGMGLTRDAVYICNIVKCHPPKNRDPEPDEIEACLPFLKHQIDIIKPEVICTLGRVAAQSLFGKAFKISSERGRWNDHRGIPVMPTYHPAYLLRNPSAKRDTWEDIKAVMDRLGLEVK
ncbi:MAG: uracil-DNA glycosylase [Deltaproteobacteria bacterium]|nr:uracil-DNA glycosylase [Deltaproteobacteria bacterium]